MLQISFYVMQPKRFYGVPRTIASINDPRNGWLYDEKFKVNVGLDNTEILAHLIEEETTMGDMMTLLNCGEGSILSSNNESLPMQPFWEHLSKTLICLKIV